MSSKAIVKDTGISVKKIKPIADLVRGMTVSDALITLRFLSSPAAKVVSKVIKSANSNAENEVSTRTDDLKVLEIYANEGNVLPQELRNAVTSPGGTTEAAIAKLEALGFQNSLNEAIKAAFTKANDLGKSNNRN